MSNINDIIQVKTSDFKVVIKKTKRVKRREASQMKGNLRGSYWKIENWLQVKVTSYFRLNFHSRLTFGLDQSVPGYIKAADYDQWNQPTDWFLMKESNFHVRPIAVDRLKRTWEKLDYFTN